jgi:hypothetical protein
MGANLLADRPLRTIHHTDYLPLLKSNVNTVTARNIRSRTICRSWRPSPNFGNTSMARQLALPNWWMPFCAGKSGGAKIFTRFLGLAAAITRDLGFILDKGMKTALEQIIVTDRRH